MAETKQIVFPGEVLEISEIKPRNGVYKNKEGKYCSEYFGTVQKGDDYIDVVPFTGHYFPRRGDKVIGKVIEIGPSMWTIDINSPYLNLMHMNDTPWKMSSGDIKRYLGIGEYIYAKVMTLNEIKESWLTIKDVGLRKLEGGHIISVPAPKVPRIIGKGGSMVNLIKEYTDTRIVIGQNGLIWIEGTPENILRATAAIKKIEREAHTTGLTDRMTEYLKGDAKNGN